MAPLRVAMSTSAETRDYWMPFVLSLLAGLSTCLGALVAFCGRKTSGDQGRAGPISHRLMSFSLALAGSVMLTVSFWSLLPESFVDDTQEAHLLTWSTSRFWMRSACFLSGCSVFWLLSRCAFPEPESLLSLAEVDTDAEAEIFCDKDTEMQALRHQISRSTCMKKKIRVRSSQKSVNDVVSVLNIGEGSDVDSLLPEKHSSSSCDPRIDNSYLKSCLSYTSGKDLATNESRRAWRAAMLLLVSLAVHNFPEGFAVAASTLHSQKLGVTTAVAIAFHNIPEGIAIAVPCLAARPDKPCLAFWLASISGFAEPLGAFVAMFFLRRADELVSESSSIMKDVLAFVAGVMVMVSLKELLPEAVRHAKEDRLPLSAGLIIGTLIIIASDAFLKT